MNDKLSKMSNQDLWLLFPIQLRPFDPEWLRQYEKESEDIKSYLPAHIIYRLSHIGSTSIGTICAKPIIDVLLEVNSLNDLASLKELVCVHGYRLMHSSRTRLDFNKGYTENGFADEVYHLHAVLKGDNRELYFRDYLRSHLEVAKEYEILKLSLAKKYEHDRDAYTNAKSTFVNKYTKLAMSEYKNRYE